MNLLNIPDAEKEEQQLIQVAKVFYHDFVIPIFTTSGEGKNLSEFYFHPLVLLDPKSIVVVNESNGFFKQEFIRFTVQMWDQELRSKVLERLRSLPSLKANEIKEDDVHIMSYEEVQLVFKQDNNELIKLMKQPTPYYPRLSETLDFYLFFESSSAAHSLAEGLRRDPEFCLRSLQLALECRGLVLEDNAVRSFKTENTQVKRPLFSFNLFTLPSSINHQVVAAMNSQVSPLIEEQSSKEQEGERLNKELESLVNTETDRMSPVPVFQVRTCYNPRAVGESFTFINCDFGTNSEYGVYDSMTGIFTVKIAGIYQFKFDALQEVKNDSGLTYIELRVDGVKAAEFLSQSPPEKRDYEPVALSTTLPVTEGQRVGVYLAGGRLYTASPTYDTIFSGFLFPDKETA